MTHGVACVAIRLRTVRSGSNIAVADDVSATEVT